MKFSFVILALASYGVGAIGVKKTPVMVDETSKAPSNGKWIPPRYSTDSDD